MMKKIVALLAVVLLFSCGGKKESSKKGGNNSGYILPESTGRINHLMIVIEDDLWKRKVGESIKKMVNDPVLGLPQEESQFKVSTIPPKAFDGMFRNSRNVLVVQLSETETFKYRKDLYSKPQTIVEVKAKTNEALIALIEKHATEITKTFKNRDLAAIQKQHRKKPFKAKINALDGLGVKMTIPYSYRKVMDTLQSFTWLRYHIAGGIAAGDQTSNIIAYQAPMFNAEQTVISQIIKNRDSIGKMYIRGNDEEKMYMITEAARKPYIKQIKLNGYTAYETRSTWEIFGAYNAGPFLNYSIVDEKNNRVVVVEGFNYAPSVSKRDFMFELEAILKTVKLN